MSEHCLALLLTGAAWMFAAWVAYDTGYDKGWWDGRYPDHSDGEADA